MLLFNKFKKPCDWAYKEMFMKIVKVFDGYSGCEIILVKNKDKTFVRKISANQNYNKRLKRQMRKQIIFGNIFTEYDEQNTPKKTLFTPRVLGSSRDERKNFFYDMEFVRGATLANYIGYLQSDEIQDLIKLFFSRINLEKVKYKTNANKIFKSKIAYLQEFLYNENSYKHYSFNKLNLEIAFKILKSFDFCYVEHSFCHGDLTLENIIICGDLNFKKNGSTNSKGVDLLKNRTLLYNKPQRIGVCLIDFLDSFFNSWQLDVAKLLQDLEFFWVFRFESISTDKAIKIYLAYKTLTQKILSLKNGKQRLCIIYHLLLLNFLRIFPYIKDEQTANFLQDAVSKLTQKIQKDFQ